MKGAVHTDVGPTGGIDSEHVLVELWTMASAIIIVICDEQQRVDHLMEKCLYQILPWPELEERDGYAYGTEFLPRRVAANASTCSHLW